MDLLSYINALSRALGVIHFSVGIAKCDGLSINDDREKLVLRCVLHDERVLEAMTPEQRRAFEDTIVAEFEAVWSCVEEHEISMHGGHA